MKENIQKEAVSLVEEEPPDADGVGVGDTSSLQDLLGINPRVDPGRPRRMRHRLPHAR